MPIQLYLRKELERSLSFKELDDNFLNLKDAIDDLVGEEADGITSGGFITWVSNYTYDVSPALYRIQQQPYDSPFTQITLDESNVEFDRIDVVAVDNTGSVVVLTGEPSENPQAPSIDVLTQLSLTFILVKANTVAPDVLQEFIYRENVEWVTESSNPSRLNPNSTTLPYAGSLNIEATNALNNTSLSFTAPNPITISDFTVLTFRIRSKAPWVATSKLVFQFYNSGAAIGSPVSLGDSVYGYNSFETSDDQIITIPLGAFGALSTIDMLLMRVSTVGSGSSIGFFIDEIQIQAGIIPPLPGNIFHHGGDTFGTTAILGTRDTFPLSFIVDGVERTRIQTDKTLKHKGNLWLDNTTPNEAGISYYLGTFGAGDYWTKRIGVTLVHNSPGGHMIRSAGTDIYFFNQSDGHVWKKAGGDISMRLLYDTGDFRVEKGSITIGNTITPANVKLNVFSDSEAVLLPRLTTVQRDGIDPVTEGMLLYNKTTHNFNFHNGTEWNAFGISGEGDGNGIYSADGQIAGDRTVDLNGKFLKIQEGNENWLLIDPVTGTTELNTRYSSTNFTKIKGSANGTTSLLELSAEHNSGNSAYITIDASGVGSSNMYGATTHNFTGAMTLIDLAGNGPGVVAVDDDGNLSWSDGSGDVPSLQQVTDVGFTTTNRIEANNGLAIANGSGSSGSTSVTTPALRLFYSTMSGGGIRAASSNSGSSASYTDLNLQSRILRISNTTSVIVSALATDSISNRLLGWATTNGNVAPITLDSSLTLSGGILSVTSSGGANTLYTADGVLEETRTVDQDGFSLTFTNSGLFRIEDIVATGSTASGIYDFNQGFDFLTYNDAKSVNVKQDLVTGISLKAINITGSTTTQLKLDVDTIILENPSESGTQFKIADYTSASNNDYLGLIDNTTGEVGWITPPEGVDGVTEVGTFGTTPTANGAVITGNTITFQPASFSHHGMVKVGDGLGVSGGVISTQYRVRKNTAGSTFQGGRINFIEGTGVSIGVSTGSGDVDVAIGFSGATTWSGFFAGSTTNITGDYTIPGGSDSVFLASNNTAPATFTLPLLAASNVNRIYFIKNRGTHDLTVEAGGSEEMFSSSVVSSVVIPPGEDRMFVSGNSYWYEFSKPGTGGSSYTDEDAQDAVADLFDDSLVYYDDGFPSIGRAALTGDVTAAEGSNETTIANDAVTYAKMQNVSATSRFLGRITTGAGNVEELTPTQATSLLDVFGASTKGLVPAAGGTPDAGKFLSETGTWDSPIVPGLADVLDVDNIANNNIWMDGGSVMFGWKVAQYGITFATGPSEGASKTLQFRRSNTLHTLDILTQGTAGGLDKTYALDFSNITANRTISFPDASGTLALLSDITGGSIGDDDYGDITVASSGATWTINNEAVTYAKIQNVTQARLLGRYTASNGSVQEITIGTGLSLNSSTGELTATGGGGGGIDGTLTAGRVPFASDSDTLTDSDKLTWADTNGLLSIGSGSSTSSIVIPNSKSYSALTTGAAVTRLLHLAADNGVYIGGIDGSASGAVRIRQGGTDRITINSSGHVGIGKTPSVALDINGGADGNALEIIKINSATRSASIGLFAADVMTFKNTHASNNSAGFDFQTRQAFKMLYMTLNGGVVVNESGVDLDFRVEGDTDTHLIFADASIEKVGIGASAPDEKLHVNGNIKVGITGTTAGKLLLAGSTSGVVTIQTAEAAGTWSLTLPTAVPVSNGYVLAGNTDGTTSWVAQSGGSLSDGDKGDITVASSGATWTIDNDAVTYAKIQNVSATSRILGRKSSGAGDIEELTGTDATALLDTFTTSAKGLVPAASGGSTTTQYLRKDGTWDEPINLAVQTLSDGSVITWDVASGENAKVTITGTGKELEIQNPVAGHTYTLEIEQGDGNDTITTWPANTTWPGGVAPTLSTADGAIDVIVFYYNGTQFRATYNGPFS